MQNLIATTENHRKMVFNTVWWEVIDNRSNREITRKSEKYQRISFSPAELSSTRQYWRMSSRSPDIMTPGLQKSRWWNMTSWRNTFSGPASQVLQVSPRSSRQEGIQPHFLCGFISVFVPDELDLLKEDNSLKGMTISTRIIERGNYVFLT